MFRDFGISGSRDSGIPKFLSAFRYSGIPVFRNPGIPGFQWGLLFDFCSEHVVCLAVADDIYHAVAYHFDASRYVCLDILHS